MQKEESEQKKCASSPKFPYEEILMIDFFSGIGGMRCALPPKRNLHSCVAYDISLYANRTYAHNFHTTEANKFAVKTKLTEQLKPSDLIDANLWTMSPPCQPFTSTKNARQRDILDKRTYGFQHIMTLLEQLKNKPRWILLENVKGFHDSRVYHDWCICLKECGYTFRQYLLNPVQFGIPNNRTRFYMICELSSRFESERGLIQTLPEKAMKAPMRPLSDFVQQDLKDATPYLVTDNQLAKDWAKDLSVVTHADTITYCFTAAYSRQLHKSTGSLLLLDQEESVRLKPVDHNDMKQYSKRIRKFTPRELLRLFGFPETFAFPEDIGLAHQYKLIGNSVNVFVVRRLMEELLYGLSHDES